MSLPDPIFQDNKDRFVIFPIKHNDIWDWYKRIQTCIWTAEEIKLPQDIKEWSTKLNDDERSFLKNIFAYFVASDRILKKISAEKFIDKVKYSEAKFFYGFQHVMENVHTEIYSSLIATHVSDHSEMHTLFETVKNNPAFQKKADWVQKWNISDSFAESLVASAASKSIFSSGAICSIFGLKKNGLMPGLVLSNELISRDKMMHSDFAILLHNNHLVNKLPKKKIKEIIKDAFEIERDFITTYFSADFMGMDQKIMRQYLEFVTDRLLIQLECEQEFNAPNLFDFMDTQNLESKNRLLQKRVDTFQNAGLTNKCNETNEISFKADF